MASVERGVGRNAKGRGTRDLDPMWSYGPGRGVDACTVAMETDAIARVLCTESH